MDTAFVRANYNTKNDCAICQCLASCLAAHRGCLTLSEGPTAAFTSDDRFSRSMVVSAAQSQGLVVTFLFVVKVFDKVLCIQVGLAQNRDPKLAASPLA
jgi:hypothetical protein